VKKIGTIHYKFTQQNQNTLYTMDQDTRQKQTTRQKREINYAQMWPIALAPLIPLTGMALKKHPKARNTVLGSMAVGILLYAHGAAIGGSKDVTG
jgi:hypothetical protein